MDSVWSFHTESSSFPRACTLSASRKQLFRIVVWFDLIVLVYMDSLNKTRSLFYIKVHENGDKWLGAGEVLQLHALADWVIRANEKKTCGFSGSLCGVLSGAWSYKHRSFPRFSVEKCEVRHSLKHAKYCMLIIQFNNRLFSHDMRDI